MASTKKIDTEWYNRPSIAFLPGVLLYALIGLWSVSVSTSYNCTSPWLLRCEKIDFAKVYPADKIQLLTEQSISESSSEGNEKSDREILLDRYAGRMWWSFFKIMGLLTSIAAYIYCFVCLREWDLCIKVRNIKPFQVSCIWPVVGLSLLFGYAVYNTAGTHMVLNTYALDRIIGSELEGAYGMPGIFEIALVTNAFGRTEYFLVALIVVLFILWPCGDSSKAVGSRLSIISKRENKGGEYLSLALRRVRQLRTLLYINAIGLISGMLAYSNTLEWIQSFLPDNFTADVQTFNIAALSITGAIFTLMLAMTYIPAFYILEQRAASFLRKGGLKHEERHKRLKENGLAYSWKTSFPRILAIIAPFISGPAQEVITKIFM